MGTTSKWILAIFKFRNDYLQTVRLEKVGEKKNGVICLVSMFPTWVMVLELSTILCWTKQEIYNDSQNIWD